MKPIPKIPGLIDYARSSVRNSLLDLYLFTQCKFFIGTSSGPILVPILFGTPVVATNYAPASARLHFGNSITVPKRLRHKSGRYPSLQETLSSSLGVDFSGAALKSSGFFYEDNSPAEIESAIREMVETLDGRVNYSSSDQQLQNFADDVYGSLSGYGNLGRIARDHLRKSSYLKTL